MVTKALVKSLLVIASGLTVYHAAGCNVSGQFKHLLSDLATVPGLGG